MINFLLNIFDSGRWKNLFKKSFLIFVMFFIYVPLVCFILLSFNNPSPKGNISTVLGDWIGIENYIKFFSSYEFSGTLSSSLINSLIICLFSIPISLSIGFLTSISIWKNYGKSKRFVFLSSNTTISCPDIVQAISFFIMFTILFVPLGINLGFFSVIITHIALQIPYVVIFLYPKFSKLSVNYLFASYDLNFNFFESVFYVIVPMIKTNLLGAILVCFSFSFDDYIITNLIRGNVSTVATELYSMTKGVKVWASVFGSIIVIFVFLMNFVSVIFKMLKFRKNNV